MVSACASSCNFQKYGLFPSRRDTDFLLVPIERGDEAVDVMRNDGWVVQLVSRKVPGSAP